MFWTDSLFGWQKNSLTRRLKFVCWCLWCVSSLHVQSWQLHSVQLLLHHVRHPQKVWKLCLRVLSTEGKKNTISVRKGYFLTSEAGGHGNQPLLKWLKCNLVCLGWTFLNVIIHNVIWSGVWRVFTLVSGKNSKKNVWSFQILVLCVIMGVGILSVKTFWTFVTVHQ